MDDKVLSKVIKLISRRNGSSLKNSTKFSTSLNFAMFFIFKRVRGGSDVTLEAADDDVVVFWVTSRGEVGRLFVKRCWCCCCRVVVVGCCEWWLPLPLCWLWPLVVTDRLGGWAKCSVLIPRWWIVLLLLLLLSGLLSVCWYHRLDNGGKKRKNVNDDSSFFPLFFFVI